MRMRKRWAALAVGSIVVPFGACNDDPTATGTRTPELRTGPAFAVVDDYALGQIVHGAIFTTTPDGGVVNANVQYTDKREVYLDGGPPGRAPITAAGLPDGLYVFQITDPPGKVLLSNDPAKCRVVRVDGGVIVQLVKPSELPTPLADSYKLQGKGADVACHVADAPDGAAGVSGRHDTNTDVDHGAQGAIVVQMMPFLDTPNPGGVYKAWMTPLKEYVAKGGSLDQQTRATSVQGKTVGYARDAGFAPPLSKVKTDNFKVRESPPFISVDKLVDANKDGLPAGDASFANPPGWPVTVTETVEGGTVTNEYLTPTGHIALPVGSTVTVCEELLADWAFSYALLNGTSVAATQQVVGAKTFYCIEVAAGSGGSVVAIAFGNIPPQPEIRIAKTPVTQRVSAGDAFSWTITLSNAGTGTAVAARIDDPLPVIAGVTYALDGYSPDPGAACSIEYGSLTCGPLDLAKGQAISATVKATTSPGQGCSTNGYLNTATGKATGLSDVQATATVYIDCPNLVITKTPASQLVQSGDPFSWTVTLSNTGDGKAVGATISDPLPVVAGVAYSLDAAASDASCALDGSVSPNLLTCGPKDLVKGASIAAVIRATTTMNTGCLANGFENKATGRAQGTSEVFATATVRILCPELKIEKTPATQTVASGQSVIWSIVLSNVGDGKATGVVVTDKLPSVSGGTYSPVPSGCSLVGLDLTCSVGELLAGASKSFTVTLRTTLGDGCGLYTNTARASGDGSLSAVSSAANARIVGCGAPLTPGYWKNHPEQQSLPQRLGAYVAPNGTAYFFVTSSAIASSVFDAMNCSSSTDLDAIGCLGGHLLATKFNFANDAPQPGCVAQAIVDADALLTEIRYVGPTGTYRLTASQRSRAISTKTTMDLYNNGSMTC